MASFIWQAVSLFITSYRKKVCLIQKIIIFVLTDTFIWGTIVTTQINHTQNTRAQNGQIKAEV